METLGLNVVKDYFDEAKIAAWKEAAFLWLLGLAALGGGAGALWAASEPNEGSRRSWIEQNM